MQFIWLFYKEQQWYHCCENDRCEAINGDRFKMYNNDNYLYWVYKDNSIRLNRIKHRNAKNKRAEEEENIIPPQFINRGELKIINDFSLYGQPYDADNENFTLYAYNDSIKGGVDHNIQKVPSEKSLFIFDNSDNTSDKPSFQDILPGYLRDDGGLVLKYPVNGCYYVNPDILNILPELNNKMPYHNWIDKKEVKFIDKLFNGVLGLLNLKKKKTTQFKDPRQIDTSMSRPTNSTSNSNQYNTPLKINNSFKTNPPLKNILYGFVIICLLLSIILLIVYLVKKYSSTDQMTNKPIGKLFNTSKEPFNNSNFYATRGYFVNNVRFATI